MLASKWGGKIKHAVILLLVLCVGACNRVQTVYTVQDHPIPTPSANRTPDQITEIIAQVVLSSGWLVDRLGPTELRATQKWRDHTAIVRIFVANNSYSIRNDGSINLLQNGDSIHRQYNDRVQKLERAIEKRLYQN